MANYSGFSFDLPMSACGDMASNQYKFVRQAGTNKWFQLANGASSPAPLGVLQDDPESGNVGTVRILGTTKVMADGDTAIVYGDYLTSGSTGMAVYSAGSNVAAIALEALASGSGVYIEALLLPFASGNKVDNTP